MHQIINHRN